MSVAWNSRTIIGDPLLHGILRQAGLPIASGMNDDDTKRSDIVCILAVDGKNLSAVIVCQSFAYLICPCEDDGFWSFAARNYYIVTGNMSDRAALATIAGVDVKNIEGKRLDRFSSSSTSGASISEMMLKLGYTLQNKKPTQSCLF